MALRDPINTENVNSGASRPSRSGERKPMQPSAPSSVPRRQMARPLRSVLGAVQFLLSARQPGSVLDGVG